MPQIPEINEVLAVDQTLDGGESGCGELLLDMKVSLKQVPPDGLLEVITVDPGAPEDLPAWCRLTGNTLLGKKVLDKRRTAYYIRKQNQA